MKRVLILCVLVGLLAVGCQEEQKKHVFSLSELKLGMSRFEIQKICDGTMELVAMQDVSDGYSEEIYRMWPNQIYQTTQVPVQYSNSSQQSPYETGQATGQVIGTILRGDKTASTNINTKPYLLTFIIEPPFTREQCQAIIDENHITDQNECQKIITTLEGWRFDSLTQISQDMESTHLQSQERQSQALNQTLLRQERQMQTANENMERLRKDYNFYEMQRFSR